MVFHEVIAIRNAFFLEVCIGILGNTILLFHILTFLEHRRKPTDLIVTQLALIHRVMLVTVGFMATSIFGSPHFWNDFNCKSLIYLYKLTRDLSICAICLLSVFQAIILSPMSSCLAKFKHISSHQNLGRFLMSTVAAPNVTTARLLFVIEYCPLWPQDYFFRHIFLFVCLFCDVAYIGLMVLSSVYVVILLCWHKRQTQNLHGITISPKASPEKRATETILVLMGFFVAMYFLDCMVSCSRRVWYNDPAGIGLRYFLFYFYLFFCLWHFVNSLQPQKPVVSLTGYVKIYFPVLI
uniref:Vomeronasal type-1 receptor n=1 Tax=Suricata suricatta TaxID=37032 RepID=A0A673TKF6_SURSU